MGQVGKTEWSRGREGGRKGGRKEGREGGREEGREGVLILPLNLYTLPLIFLAYCVHMHTGPNLVVDQVPFMEGGTHIIGAGLLLELIVLV